MERENWGSGGHCMDRGDVRSRFTHLSSITSFEWPGGDRPPSATLFKGKTEVCLKLVDRAKAPRKMLIQYQEFGSYREVDLLEYLDWAVPWAKSAEDSI